jgi:diguanylate cyclase (GGDEF)-like protein
MSLSADKDCVRAFSQSVHSRKHALLLGSGLFAGGAVLTLAATVLPRSPQVDMAGAWVLFLAASLAAAVFWLGRDSLPFWTVFVGIVIGTAMITFGVYVNGERDGGAAAVNEIYYVWPVVFTAYYFSVRLLVVEISIVAVLYAIVLTTIDPGPIGVTRWLIVVTMLVGLGGLISRLQATVVELVDRLSDTARRDPLTGLLNRRGFEERLDAELARATRGERPAALILADLDRFKTVNDRLGHPAGDAVLLRVAEILEGVGRRGDTVARMGGEEFVFIVPDADAVEAYELAERLRAEVEEAFADEPVKLTISCGAVAFPVDGTTADTLMAAADEALYSAKRAGRNRSERAVAGSAAAALAV